MRFKEENYFLPLEIEEGRVQICNNTLKYFYIKKQRLERR